MSDSNKLLLANTRALISGLTGMGGHGYFVWDYESNQMIAGGDRLAELYGYKEEDIEKRPGGESALNTPAVRRSTVRIVNS